MRILVADDEFGSRLIAQATVQALGHECQTATDGDEAWKLIAEFEPHVLVTDRSMPGCDGLELCRRVRADSTREYLYIVIVTSLDDPTEVLESMRAGADDFLSKPLQPFDLEARLLAAERVTDLHRELARMRLELAFQANTDSLTGLRNRQGMAADLTQLHLTSVRYDRTYSVALFDVDFFKRYNDSYGHPAGDEALRHVASALRAGVRDVDHVYRYGGEEFLIVFPDQAAEASRVPVDRVRSSLAGRAIEHRAGGPSRTVTVSVGIAASTPSRRIEPEQLLVEADAALYRAKQLGRDRLELAPGGVATVILRPSPAEPWSDHG